MLKFCGAGFGWGRDIRQHELTTIDHELTTNWPQIDFESQDLDVAAEKIGMIARAINESLHKRDHLNKVTLLPTLHL